VRELVKCKECKDTGLVAVQLPEGGLVIEPCMPCSMEDYIKYIDTLDFYDKHGIN
jgi:hypothetical protein|tara:strand:+ start:2236 stop:2400 length:165 start_codon:yes stop_codon:yes gene_type:complete